jgi:hypothetical protein
MEAWIDARGQPDRAQRASALDGHRRLAIRDGKFLPLHQRDRPPDSLARSHAWDPLAEAGLLSSMPSWRMVATLVLLGY